MTPEIQQLKLRIAFLETQLKSILIGDRIRLPTRIELNSDLGTMFGLNPSEKVGFYGTIPVVQNTSPNGKQDKSGSGGASVTDGTGYNGNTGSFYYTIGDLVYALKQVGLIDT